MTSGATASHRRAALVPFMYPSCTISSQLGRWIEVVRDGALTFLVESLVRFLDRSCMFFELNFIYKLGQYFYTN
jgi:hypothetical protein